MPTAKKLPSGNWRARAVIKNIDGTRSFKSFTAADKKEAEFMALEYENAHNLENTPDITLEAAARRYIESKRNVTSPSTIRGYQAIIRSYVPELLPRHLKSITQEDIQISINNMAKKYSPKTCRNVHGFISAVLGAYRPDFTLHTTLPQKIRHDIYVPDVDEIKHILKLAKGTINEIPIFLAAECGLRASEISALRTENVKSDKIIIKEALVLGDDGEEHLKAPKSWSGYRSIPISETAYNRLISSAENGRVCPRKAVNICNNWDKFRKKHGIDERLNFHALRHHYASKCILLGIPQKYIAELMGHSSTDMIEKVYQHIFPSAMEEYGNLLRQQMDDLED